VTEEELQEILVRQQFVCACGCGRSVILERHWDHRVPLSKGGKHAASNLQAMTPICNMRKGAR
jgi:5-methylcytosine-specific restriction endonuclease McrA